ncbi:hypothetical protein ACKJRL_09925 [Streptococcus pneumoniae]|uniref:hypothetical protein n=1 Tax=Streptococcus pneumoniae TaxID=1313 RepID=UPI003989AB21
MENLDNQEITITRGELKQLISDAIRENGKVTSNTIFNKSTSILKRKSELHLKYPILRKMVELSASIYHPDPYRFEFASINRFNQAPSLKRIGSANQLHEIARKFALLCFGVDTNTDLSASDEEKAVSIYNEVIEIFFNNYEKHLEDKFGGDKWQKH